MRVVQVLTQAAGGPVDHAVDVTVELQRRGLDCHLVAPAAVFAGGRGLDPATCHVAEAASKTDAAGALALARTVRRLRPDVVHCQDRRAGLLGRTLGRPAGSALVYTLHGVAEGLTDLVPGNLRAVPRRRRDRWYYLTGERWLARLTGSRLVVPSAAIARFVTEHVRLSAECVDVVPNGVDTVRFAPGDARCGEGPLTVVWLGQLLPAKRLDVLLTALVELPRLRLRLVGDGPERDRLEKAAAERGVADRTVFAGATRDPAAALAGADLFALPSAAENCPLALLQAMSCGLPAVASAVGGVPEVVTDGVDGLLVPPGDPAALAAALARLAGDAALRARLGSAARARVVDAFGLPRCVDGLLGSYERALA
jgi:glycosyltransferase involved in cell wall biosynthesis